MLIGVKGTTFKVELTAELRELSIDNNYINVVLMSRD